MYSASEIGSSSFISNTGSSFSRISGWIGISNSISSSSSSLSINTTSGSFLLTETITSSLFLLSLLFILVPTTFIIKMITNESVASPTTLTMIPKVESLGSLFCNLSQKDCSSGVFIPCSTICLMLNKPCSL